MNWEVFRKYFPRCTIKNKQSLWCQNFPQFQTITKMIKITRHFMEISTSSYKIGHWTIRASKLPTARWQYFSNQWVENSKEIFSWFMKLHILTSYISRAIIFTKSSSTLVLLAWAIWAKVVRRQISSELFMEERHFSKFTKCSGSVSS